MMAKKTAAPMYLRYGAAILFTSTSYACLMAPVGHASAQLPHSIQVSGLISKYSEPCEIAETGQVPSQEPQQMQSLLMENAIGTPPIVC